MISIEKLIPEDVLQKRVKELAETIKSDYEGKTITLERTLDFYVNHLGF